MQEMQTSVHGEEAIRTQECPEEWDLKRESDEEMIADNRRLDRILTWQVWFFQDFEE
jgi:uncharacterized protein YijF (DUF1287 family)